MDSGRGVGIRGRGHVVAGGTSSGPGLVARDLGIFPACHAIPALSTRPSNFAGYALALPFSVRMKEEHSFARSALPTLSAPVLMASARSSTRMGLVALVVGQPG